MMPKSGPLDAVFEHSSGVTWVRRVHEVLVAPNRVGPDAQGETVSDPGLWFSVKLYVQIVTVSCKTRPCKVLWCGVSYHLQ